MDLLAVKVVLKTTSNFQSKHLLTDVIRDQICDDQQIETPENGIFAIVLF